MALIKCKECGNEISNKAEKCIKCGNPIAKQSSLKETIQAVATLFVIGIFVYIYISSGSSGTKNDAPASAEKTCKADDLQCLGDKGIIGASVYCKSPVEHMALHEVKWTDGAFETKFSRFRWKDKEKGIITYIGDKALFQDGFGAFNPITYFCDMAPDNQTVLEVHTIEGRL